MAESPASALPTWIPAVTALGGVVIGLFAPLLASFTTVKREREARVEARKDAAKQKQNDFQRETLLQLQDVASDLLKTANAMHVKVLGIKRGAGAWDTKFPQEILDGIGKGLADVERFGSRVLDDVARGCCLDMGVALGDMILAHDPEAFEARFEKFFLLKSKFTQLAGERLRILERDSLAL